MPPCRGLKNPGQIDVALKRNIALIVSVTWWFLTRSLCQSFSFLSRGTCQHSDPLFPLYLYSNVKLVLLSVSPPLFRVTHGSSSSVCPAILQMTLLPNKLSFLPLASVPSVTFPPSLPPRASHCTCFPPALCSLSKRHFSPSSLLLHFYSPPR